MLFDLRGRGRRRTVRVIYIGLALLMGVGLVGFGIGGGFGGGGLLNAASSNEGSSSASFSSEITKYRKLTKRQPSNVAAWEKLTKALLHEAGSEAYVSSAGVVTSKGKQIFAEAARAWSSYIALNPPNPSPVAQLMLPVYGEEGLNQPSKAVEILQIVTAAKPNSASLYASLAEYSYKAKNVREGDLASEKAVSLAPAAQRERVKKELEELKKNPSGEKSYTLTTNGKVYVGKLSKNGTFTPTSTASAVKPTSTGTTTSTGTSTTGSAGTKKK